MSKNAVREALASVQGKIVPLVEAMVPALDRGFLFADAVYEVLRVYRGRMYLAAGHFRRLERSLAAIRIEGVNVSQ
jgi:D-alanine transaminase